MPIYDYRCDKCGQTIEILQLGDEKSPICCERAMRRLISVPAMIGKKARKKWAENWTPDSPPFRTGSLHGEKY